MATRERPGDLGAADARDTAVKFGKEIRASRRRLGLSLSATGRHAGISGSQLGRIERGTLQHPTCRAAVPRGRAVGLKPAFELYPDADPVRDRGQLASLERLEKVLAPPLRLRREVPIPIAGDLRAWDGRTSDGERTGVVRGRGSARRHAGARARRIARKQRDDPRAGVVILVVNRTAHNRRVLAAHREALRDQFPLDGGRSSARSADGRVPPASGILML